MALPAAWPLAVTAGSQPDGELDDGKGFGIDLHDFGTTFKAYRREIIQEIQLYGELHRFIPALASSTGAKIAELPLASVAGKEDKRRYGIARTIRVLLDLMIVKFLLDYSTRPGQFFGLVGVGSTALSFFAVDGSGIRQVLFSHRSDKRLGTAGVLAVALFLVGIQFSFHGIARRNYSAHLLRITEQADLRSARSEKPPQRVGRFRGADAAFRISDR